ncbi:MAG: hypothetical protein M9894_17025 [Planctomycetes bacterium]|nr:hypothetical protein [Planctomycetota bacterium]
MSEEQWNDLKFKITIAVVLLVVGGCVYAIGPGLEKFRDRARLRKTEPWAPEWYFKIGRIYEATWRMDKAVDVYQEFYLHWSGDEQQFRYELNEVLEEAKFDLDFISFYPDVAGRYTKDTRPAWVGGEGAKPHPLMAEVLMRLCRFEEDRRNYHTARYYYLVVLKCFPEGTQAHKDALAAQKRYAQRGM